MNGIVVVASLAALLLPDLATAKDLPPRRAEEARKTTGCEYLGEGYVKAAGSDTCIRVGGFVRTEGSVILNR